MNKLIDHVSTLSLDKSIIGEEDEPNQIKEFSSLSGLLKNKTVKIAPI